MILRKLTLSEGSIIQPSTTPATVRYLKYMPSYPSHVALNPSKGIIASMKPGDALAYSEAVNDDISSPYYNLLEVKELIKRNIFTELAISFVSSGGGSVTPGTVGTLLTLSPTITGNADTYLGTASGVNYFFSYSRGTNIIWVCNHGSQIDIIKYDETLNTLSKLGSILNTQISEDALASSGNPVISSTGKVYFLATTAFGTYLVELVANSATVSWAKDVVGLPSIPTDTAFLSIDAADKLYLTLPGGGEASSAIYTLTPDTGAVTADIFLDAGTLHDTFAPTTHTYVEAMYIDNATSNLIIQVKHDGGSSFPVVFNTFNSTGVFQSTLDQSSYFASHTALGNTSGWNAGFTNDYFMYSSGDSGIGAYLLDYKTGANFPIILATSGLIDGNISGSATVGAITDITSTFEATNPIYFLDALPA